MKYAVYINFSELSKRFPERAELTAIVSGLSAMTGTMVALRLNNIFRYCTGRNAAEMPVFQSWFAENYLSPELRQELISKFGNVNAASRPLCHPLQLLYLAKLAAILGRDDAQARNESLEGHVFEFGTASLMINDLFCTPQEREALRTGSQDQKTKELMTQLSAANDLSNPTPIRNLFVRAFVTYSICLKSPELIERIKKEACGLNFEQDFEKLVGLPVMAWLSIVVGLFFSLRGHSMQQFITKPEVYVLDRRVCLANSLLEHAQINGFFDTLSMTFEEFRKTMGSSARPVDERLDLLPFKAKPFLNVAPEAYACFDTALLAEQLHSGPYFALWSRLSSKQERDWASSAWGLVFESYVQWLLSGIRAHLGGELNFDTAWTKTGEKSFDAILVRARLVAVFEFKSGFMTQEARYSNDSEKFMEDLTGKIGKGCTQLARDIAALFPPNGVGDGLTNVELPRKVEFVLPVLVVQESMLRNPFVNYFLNRHFQAALASSPVRGGIEVLPLNVIHITALEGMTEMAEVQGLDLIGTLLRRSRADSSMRLLLNDFLDTLPEIKKPHQSPRFEQIFVESQKEISKLLTGKDPKSDSVADSQEVEPG